MAKTLIGLDIGNYSVKIVEILKKNGDIQLLSCGHKVLSKNTPLGDQYTLLKDLCKQSGISNDKIKTSVSGKNIITRYAIFPPMTKASLEHSLKFEHEKYIPFPLNNCIVDLNILGKRPDGKINVLIVSAEKSYIEERVNLIKTADLFPESISVDALALYHVFAESSFFSKSNSFVLLNVGCKVTNSLIIKKGDLVFSRDINIGGDNFTRAIADKKGVSLDEAEKFKCTSEEAPLLEIISIDLNSLMSEIELSIAYSKKNYDLGDIEYIYISGGSSKLAGLKTCLENTLKIKTDFWNPFLKLKKSKKCDILENRYHDLILSLGIALT